MKQTELYSNQSIFEQYKHAIDVSSIVSKTDHRGIITYVNDRFCEISGYSREELIGQPHNIVRGLDMPTGVFKGLWETIQSKNVWRGILHNRAKDGSRYSVKTTISPIVDSTGKIYEFIAIREDVTELEGAKKKAEENARIKGDFLANMSHEIRTPMNGIVGFVDLLKNTPLTDQQKRYLEIIAKSTGHLLSIVNEILDFSKIENNKMVLDPVDSDLKKELSLLCAFYEPNADEKKLDYRVVIDPKISDCLKVDFHHLKQILSNLISNSIKFTDEGFIEIVAIMIQEIGAHQRIRFKVSDSGIGIAAENQQKIFDAFSQADTSTTRKYGGTGLGLSISSKLVALMDSRLQLKSDLNAGSEFYFDVDFLQCTTKTDKS